MLTLSSWGNRERTVKSALASGTRCGLPQPSPLAIPEVKPPNWGKRFLPPDNPLRVINECLVRSLYCCSYFCHLLLLAGLSLVSEMDFSIRCGHLVPLIALR